MIPRGEKLNLPLTIANAGPATEVTLHAVLPEGWRDELGTAIYPLEAHSEYTVQTVLRSPANAAKGWVSSDIVWKADVGGREIGAIHMRVLIGSGVLPQ
jgi:uncharacterized membrane protein